MLNVSNQYGRALEYIIVENIIECFPEITFIKTDRCQNDQLRDRGQFLGLSTAMQGEYNHTATLLSTWLNQNFDLGNTITIDRLNDSAGQAGIVTDIRLENGFQNINLSIKHNHFALKHQRPEGVPQSLGIMSGSDLDIDYRNGLSLLMDDFFNNARIVHPNLEKWSELKEIDSNYINSNLYEPINDYVRNFLMSQNNRAAQYFNFLVGTENYYKIIDLPNQIEIREFNNLPIPDSFTINVIRSSTISVAFSNGWDIPMRLHTASSRIPSTAANSTGLKYDSQPPVNIEALIPAQRIMKN